MLRHLEDKRRCPHCGEQLYQQPYLMSRQATENVLSWTQIAWVVAAVLILLVLVNA